MERSHSDGKHLRPQSNRTSCVHYKLKIKYMHYKLKIKYMHQRHHPQKQIDSFYNDVDETLGKPNHYTIVMGDFIEQIGKRTSPRNGNGQIWTRIEKRKRRHLGRMSIIKKVQNHEYHVPVESREEMDMEKPNQCNEARN